MRITVNGKHKQITDPTSIAALFEMVGVNPEQVVAEHNGTILAPQQYRETILREGDTIELIQFVGGG
ncbi:sulfur carrier protein ThiS [Pelovirga terrestris]|uniref:Sulfur carrier protein ThiS n=1 Tax=Pelovirga terrestris TaxID=2771352 RepID=A0A8J6QW32_9BACT|nr:sulfur carrier protein ThiS [Pelovirga terrestris]MBD1399501.1 sulfur carrier protein ThiS [Pelovirga terrestris]